MKKVNADSFSSQVIRRREEIRAAAMKYLSQLRWEIKKIGVELSDAPSEERMESILDEIDKVKDCLSGKGLEVPNQPDALLRYKGVLLEQPFL